MQANLTRLTDLTGELRRQLKPLGKQAEIARRAAGVQAELRDSRLRLLADDLVHACATQLRSGGRRRGGDPRPPGRGRGALSARRGHARAELEQALAADAPRVARAQETWYRLAALEERFRGTASLAAERARHLAAEPEARRPGRDPEALEAEAAEVRARGAAAAGRPGRRRSDRLPRPSPSGRSSSAAWPRPSARCVAAARAVADRREGLAKLAGQVNALRTRARPRRRRDRPARAPPRRRPATRAAPRRGRTRPGAGTRSARWTRASSASTSGTRPRWPRTRRSRPGSANSPTAEREAERERSTWSARAEALAMGLDPQGRRAARCSPPVRGCPACSGRSPRCSPSSPGHEAALAAALGAAADAVAVGSARRRRTPRWTCSRPTTPAGPGCWSAASTPPADRADWPSCPPAPGGRSTLVDAPERFARQRRTPLLDRRRRRRRPGRWRASCQPTRPTCRVGHPRRRRARRRLGGRRLVVRRRARSRSRPRWTRRAHKADEAAARHERLQRAAGRVPRPRRAAARPRSSRRSTRCTSPTPGCPRSPSSWPSSGRSARSAGAEAQPARRSARRRRAGPRPRPGRPVRPRGAAAPGRGAVRRAARAGHRRARRRCTPRSARPGRPRWTPGWPCAPARSGCAPSPDAPSSCCAPPRSSARRGAPGTSRPGRPGPRRRASPPRCATPRALRSARIEPSVGRGCRSSATPPSRPASRARASCSTLRARTRELAEELARLTDAVHRDEMVRAEQRLRIEQLETARGRGVRRRGRRPARRVRPRPADPAERDRDGRVRAGPRARRAGRGARSPGRSTGRPRRSGPPAPNAISRCWAR